MIEYEKTAINMWTQFIAKTQPPEGLEPEKYSQMKLAYYCGAFSFFVVIRRIGNQKDSEAALGLKLKDFVKSTQRLDYPAKAEFDEWFLKGYPDGAKEGQKKCLLVGFMAGMHEAYKIMDFISGPVNEDDDLGAARVEKFETALTNLVKGLVS